MTIEVWFHQNKLFTGMVSRLHARDEYNPGHEDEEITTEMLNLSGGSRHWIMWVSNISGELIHI